MQIPAESYQNTMKVVPTASLLDTAIQSWIGERCRSDLTDNNNNKHLFIFLQLAYYILIKSHVVISLNI